MKLFLLGNIKPIGFMLRYCLSRVFLMLEVKGEKSSNASNDAISLDSSLDRRCF